MGILETLIAKDYTLIDKGNRWATTAEHDSLVIDKEKQRFFWNSRGIVGDAITWLMLVKGLPFGEARKAVSEFKDFTSTFIYTIKGEFEEDDIVIYPELVNVFWENGLRNRKYWYDRLLTDDTINRFQLGYYDNWYTIPFFMDGTLRNIQCRKDDPKTIRPWWRGLSPLLYNSDILKLVSKVVISEGTVDAIFLSQLGYPAISTNSGSNWQHNLWYDKFLRLDEIIVIADNDKPGIQFGVQIAESLGTNRVRIATFDNYPAKMDSIEFFRSGGTKDEFKNILDNAKYIEEFGGNFLPRIGV